MEHKFEDIRAEKLEKVPAPDSIPLFGGRPARKMRIGKDDAMDLKILLNTTLDVGHFVAKC